MRSVRTALALLSSFLFLTSCSATNSVHFLPNDQDGDRDAFEQTDTADGDDVSTDGDEVAVDSHDMPFEVEAEAETEAEIEADADATEADLEFDGDNSEALEEDIELHDWPASETALDGYVVRMVKDIKTESDYSGVRLDPNAKLGADVLFTASRPWEGPELWKTDGTEAGTRLVKDIYPGPAASNFSLLAVMDGFLLLWADDGEHGSELWRSDGSEAGTYLVKDFFPGKDNSRISNYFPFFFYGKALLSVTDDANKNNSIWSSDGTEAGTQKLFDVSELPGDVVNVYSGFPWRGSLYFFAYTSASKSVLLKSDGTAAGTSVLARDLSLGAPVPLGDHLLFLKKTPENIVSLWKSDGTAEGTTELKAFVTPYGRCNDMTTCNPWAMSLPNFAQLGAFSDRYWFVADDAEHGPELWVSNGTPEGTALFADLNPGTEGSYPQFLKQSANSLFFIAHDASHGGELWKTDGTPITTGLVKDIMPGYGSGMLDMLRAYYYAPSDSAMAPDGRLFFKAHSPTYGDELWESDGTEEGTRLVKDIVPGSQGSYPQELVWQGDHLLFGKDYELWRSDGTESGTKQVLKINPANQGSSPYKYAEVNSQLLFYADGGIWASNGTESGTRRIFDNFTPGTFTEIQIQKANGRLFFGNSTEKGSNNTALWQSDGTVAGTTLVKQFKSPASLSLFTAIQDKLFFMNGTSKLWQSDGTTNGTFKSTDLTQKPIAMLATDEHLFFATGTQLLIGNRNGNGLFTAKEFEAQPGLFGYSLSRIGNKVFFIIKDSTQGYQIWGSDGTSGGTQLFLSLQSAAAENSYADMMGLGDTLFFTISDPTNGYDAWVSDGTLANTTRLAPAHSIKPLPYSSARAKKFRSAIYFWKGDDTYTYELWKTDGTSAGTSLVRAFPQDEPVQSGSLLVEFAGRLFFPAWDAEHGLEPWATDGTPEGTALVADIAPGKANSYPWSMFAMGERLFLTAADNLHGQELWVIESKAAQ